MKSDQAQSHGEQLAFAIAAHKSGRLNDAEPIYLKLIRYYPTNFDILYGLGLLNESRGKSFEAIKYFRLASKENPNSDNIYFNLGLLFHKAGQYEDALKHFDHAIELNPFDSEYYMNRGVTLRSLAQYQDAVESYDSALRISPSSAEILYNRGLALHSLSRFDEALASFKDALKLKPNFAAAHCNFGEVLFRLDRLDEALRSCELALQIDPGLAEAHRNKGLVLLSLARPQNAVECFEKAAALNANMENIHIDLGNAFHALDRYEEALENYNRAVDAKARGQFLIGNLLFVKRKLCNWKNLDKLNYDIIKGLSRGEHVIFPIPSLSVTDNQDIHLTCAKTYSNLVASQKNTFPAIVNHPRGEKIRVGYFSSDFWGHATSFLAAELFQRHDRSRFELTAFSFGPKIDDEISRRLPAYFDNFLNVHEKTNEEIAALSRQRQIDIAINLNGLTKHERTRIFSMRAAPIQVSYLGYPGTMGTDFMDYILADDTVIRETDKKYYTEKVIHLPNCYQPNDSRRFTSHPESERAACNLPEKAFVFCCFNNSYKISPIVFDSWIRILKAVDSSVLWLLKDNEKTPQNLQQEAKSRGVDPERIIYADWAPMSEHLARHRCADLFLDTLPYNAHTTGSDALWTGLPVLTCLGESFAGRVAASLLKAAGIPELITPTAKEYEFLAIELAKDPDKLAAIRQRLMKNRLTAPLFNISALTNHIEAAYTAIHERHHAGLAPDHIRIGV